MLKKLSIAILITFGFTFSSFAQNIALSPYSRFAVGDLQNIQKPRNTGIGGISLGLVGQHDVSYMNPASYMNVDSMSVLFDVSFNYAGATLRQEIDGNLYKSTSNSASLNTLNLAFPITKWLKSSFGLVPTSSISYDVKQIFEDNPILGKYILNNYGTGGFNKVYFGLALGTPRISVGANINYHFGYSERNAELVYYDTIFAAPTASQIYKTFEAKGIGYDFGIQYRQPLGKKYQLGLGLSYSPSYNLSGHKKTDVYSIASAYTDTILNGEKLSYKILIPESYAVGLSFQKNGRWLLAAEYRFSDYGKYEEDGLKDPYLGQTWSFKVGGEIMGNRYSENFFSQLTYRVGYQYNKNYLSYNNEDLFESNFSIGLGIPIRRTYSRLDISFEFGTKGNYKNGQIQENFNRITVGISAFEYWFMRRKYD